MNKYTILSYEPSYPIAIFYKINCVDFFSNTEEVWYYSPFPKEHHSKTNMYAASGSMTQGNFYGGSMDCTFDSLEEMISWVKEK